MIGLATAIYVLYDMLKINTGQNYTQLHYCITE